MHLHKIWDALKISRLFQAGVLLVILSGLAEGCDQLGAVDLTSIPYLGKYSAAILATAGLAKIVFRAVALLITAYQGQDVVK